MSSSEFRTLRVHRKGRFEKTHGFEKTPRKSFRNCPRIAPEIRSNCVRNQIASEISRNCAKLIRNRVDQAACDLRAICVGSAERAFFAQLRLFSDAIASDFGRNCVGFRAQLRHDLRVRVYSLLKSACESSQTDIVIGFTIATCKLAKPIMSNLKLSSSITSPN